MKYEQLTKIHEAPNLGVVLMYLRTQVIFKKYEDLENVIKEIGSEEILEIHLFDKDKEYRAISSRKGAIEYIADFKKDDNCVVDKQIIENKFSSVVKNINIITKLKSVDFSSQEACVSSIEDYRLSLEGE